MSNHTHTPTGQRFWSKVAIVDDADSCWLWTAAKFPKGYGRFATWGRNAAGYVLAHRMSYELERGDIPDGYYVDHICHQPSCVRPSHLRAVTPKQNQENFGGLRKNNTSGVHGVSWSAAVGKWTAQVRHRRTQLRLGYFDSLEEAKAAVVAKRLELHTHNDLDRVGA